MARTYEISFKLGAQMAGNFAKTMTSASGALNQLNGRIAQINKSQSSINKLVKLRETVRDTTEEFKAAKRRTEQYRKVMQALGTKEATQQFQKAERATARLKTRLDRQRQSLLSMNRELGKSKTRTADLVAEQKQLARSAEKARAAQSSLQKTLSAQQANIAKRGELRGQLFDAVALGATLAVPIREAVKFESVLADLNKVANLSKSQLGAMSTQINTLSRSTGIAREEISQMYEAAAQAGFARSEWDAYVDTASKMAVAFDLAGEESGQMLRNWRAGMSLTMDEATALGNTVNHLSNNMNANAAAIGQVIQRQGAVARANGLTTQETAALSAALLSSGASNEVAATALKNMTSRLTMGAAATKRQKEAFQALGLDAEVMAQRMQQDAAGAITTVIKSLQARPADERGSLASMLFGEESKGAIMPLINDMTQLSKAMTLAGERTSSMLDEYNTRSQTTERQLARMSATTTVLAGNMGSALLPAVNSVLNVLIPITGAAADLAQQFPMVTAVVIGGTAALIALKVATIAGAYAFTFIKGAWLAGVAVLKTLRVAYLLHTGAIVAGTNATKAAVVVSKAMTAAQWLFNAALTANPIGIVIVAIGALVAAGIWMYKNWEKVTAFFGAAWQKLKGWFVSFSPVGWMMKGMNALFGWVNRLSLANSGRELVKTFASGIWSAATYPARAMAGVLKKVRKYLPFSDAKVGPLSELTASGQSVMTTLSKGMAKTNTTDMMKPFDASAGGVVRDISGLASKVGGVAANSGGGGVTLNVTQNLALSGDSDSNVRQQARDGARQGASDMLEELRAAMGRERRVSFG